MSDSAGPLRALMGLVALSGLGCGAKSVELERLIQDGRDNEVRAVAKYENRRIAVTGTVAEVGLTKVERLSAKHQYYMGSFGTSRLHRSQENHPYVVLKSPSGDSEDQLVCYFTPDEMDTVGEFTDGMDVTLEGRFQEYSEDEGVMMVVLTGCKEK
jgi:hypothetical protein